MLHLELVSLTNVIAMLWCACELAVLYVGDVGFVRLGLVLLSDLVKPEPGSNRNEDRGEGA